MRDARPPRAAVALALLLAAPALAPASAAAGWPLDLGEVVPAGAFRAYRIRLLEPAVVEYGGFYQGTTTAHAALPMVGWLQRADGRWSAGVVLAEDRAAAAAPHDLHATWRGPAGAHQVGRYAPEGGYYFTTANRLPAGEVLVALATAHAEGEARLVLRVGGAAKVLAAQAGASFYARGLDHSAEAYDVEARANHPLLGGPGHVRAWRYSGAELPLEVHGRLLGYVGYLPAGAHWRTPSGEPRGPHVLAEPGGAWQAVFPAAEWHRPLCRPGGEWSCVVLHDRDRDPPFALGLDLRL